jgi:hypothetical protein
MAQRRLWYTLDEAVSNANDQGVPSGWRAHRISPRGVCRSSTKSMACSTTGHIVSRKPESRVVRKWCHVPVATYAQQLASSFGSSTPSCT